jgi:hypothetical protein
VQEELENRTVTLMVSSSKFTGRTLKSAISHFLNYTRHKAQDHKHVVPHGKQSVKQLMGQRESLMNEPVGDDADLRTFDRIARKYCVDYAVKKVQRDGQDQYLIFFKARDKDTIYAAMQDYANHWKEHGKEEKPSVRKLIAIFRKHAELDKDRAEHKEISR